ncbi:MULTISPECIES: 16S rRNA (guanine(527)-N(7))-methyltransferase RsmG [Carnobacterium]|jgi:16S rRNA (guanine527-N7)-methyltransferase|uniref:Ribosomal RNA small subunit methyltransferase G n=2 Tax=Carnobacterium inhibens TaxID=147709 RepID=U5SFT7_9LACT|nr:MULTISPECIES: 16S rRNA (guanine(527)-N(7))-methyltransferase RsmG [Carnobacterium]AGY82727.1 16S rRNA methyltransferase [Carnobacterium inhibens subsp. gilichinskyi]MBC9825529.1 16S rRNA (guanine(527)-N(7))-methyltransferase RsmG [Carnobacterium inhibens]MCM3513078.1 16S rRNA (guanine(527)-N(7))-methyltransferase RsmG [Carnobacterium inhibens]MDN5371822.1 rRNA (guanine527-N7)-methyltransferase [Carnobacterium sp.]
MNPEEFKKALEDKGMTVTEKQMEQFDQYLKLLQEWNEKINLTAITQKEEVYLKHFYDSITAGLYVDFKNGVQSLCDVGAGAGFPSIPLKIMFPQLEVTIVDSLNKRIQFLTLLAETLGLEGVHFYHDRAETFGQNKQFRESFDFVTARAVARMSVLAELCLPLTKKGGLFIALKASNTKEEMDEGQKAIATLGGKFREEFVFELPHEAGERHIVLIDKKKETPKKYPRKPGTPNKNPL